MPDSRAIVLNYIDRVWNQHDHSIIDETIRADYIQHSPTVPPGRERVKAFFKMIESSFSNVSFSVEDMIAEGDKHIGTFQGIPATNKDFALSGISILRLDDGKFAELWVEQDLVGLMSQLRV